MPNSNRNLNLFERHTQLIESISLIQRKKELEADWFANEVNTVFFPAQEVSKLNRRPDIFDKKSAVAIAMAVLAVLPAILLFPFWVQTFRRRSRKIEEMRKVQSKINSILPAKFDAERGDFIPKEYEKFLPDLIEEGIIFDSVISDLEMTIMDTAK